MIPLPQLRIMLSCHQQMRLEPNMSGIERSPGRAGDLGEQRKRSAHLAEKDQRSGIPDYEVRPRSGIVQRRDRCAQQLDCVRGADVELRAAELMKHVCTLFRCWGFK